MLSVLLILLGLAPEAHARCKARPATASQLETALDNALGAARKLDDATFEQSAGVVNRLLPCLDEPVTPELASEFHLVGALSAFYAGDLRVARLSFAAARSWTLYELDQTLFPDGTRLRAVHDAPSPPTRFVRFSQPLMGSLTIDGVRRPDRPDARPLIAQYVSETGSVQQTDLVYAGEPLPTLDLTPEVSEAVVSTTEVEEQPTRTTRRRRAYRGPNPSVLLVAGIAAAGAGVLYFLSREEYSIYNDASTPLEDVEQARLNHNRMLLGAWAAGGTAATLGVGAFVVGAF